MSLVNTQVIQDERQSIAYHNRHFKFQLLSHRPDADFQFNLQPPNEAGFSDRYSQCLIKISYVHLSNRGDANRFGLGSQFQAVVGAAIEACESGVLLTSDIKSVNHEMIYDRDSQGGNTGVMAVLQNKFGSTGVNGAFLATNTKCGASAIRGANADNVYKVNAWEFRDDRPIEDSGVLCANPFGRQINFRLRNPDNGVQPLRLTAEDLPANVASHGASIQIELEVLMLENPKAGVVR